MFQNIVKYVRWGGGRVTPFASVRHVDLATCPASAACVRNSCISPKHMRCSVRPREHPSIITATQSQARSCPLTHHSRLLTDIIITHHQSGVRSPESGLIMSSSVTAPVDSTDVCNGNDTVTAENCPALPHFTCYPSLCIYTTHSALTWCGCPL